MKALGLPLAGAVALACAGAPASAALVGASYDFATPSIAVLSSTGPGRYTDPFNPRFCLGGGTPDNCVGNSLLGVLSFADVSATEATLTFTFTGNVLGERAFGLTLGNFGTTDGSTVTDIAYRSGAFGPGDGTFGLTSFANGVATFAGTPDVEFDNFFAFDGVSFVFDVTLEPPAPIPLPAAAWMLLAGLGALAALRRR